MYRIFPKNLLDILVHSLAKMDRRLGDNLHATLKTVITASQNKRRQVKWPKEKHPWQDLSNLLMGKNSIKYSLIIQYYFQKYCQTILFHPFKYTQKCNLYITWYLHLKLEIYYRESSITRRDLISSSNICLDLLSYASATNWTLDE